MVESFSLENDAVLFPMVCLWLLGHVETAARRGARLRHKLKGYILFKYFTSTNSAMGLSDDETWFQRFWCSQNQNKVQTNNLQRFRGYNELHL